MQTEHNYLNYRIHIMAFSLTKQCRKCRRDDDTSLNVICQCLALDKLRQQTLKAFFIESEGIITRSVRNILGFNKSSQINYWEQTVHGDAQWAQYILSLTYFPTLNLPNLNSLALLPFLLPYVISYILIPQPLTIFLLLSFPLSFLQFYVVYFSPLSYIFSIKEAASYVFKSR